MTMSMLCVSHCVSMFASVCVCVKKIKITCVCVCVWRATQVYNWIICKSHGKIDLFSVYFHIDSHVSCENVVYIFHTFQTLVFVLGFWLAWKNMWACMMYVDCCIFLFWMCQPIIWSSCIGMFSGMQEINKQLSYYDCILSISESRFKVQTKVIAADFTRADIYDTIKRELNGLEIGTLGKFGTWMQRTNVAKGWILTIADWPVINKITWLSPISHAVNQCVAVHE